MHVLAHREDGGGGAQQQQSVVVSLRHIRRSDTLNHQLHAELIFIQDVWGENHRGDGGEKPYAMRHDIMFDVSCVMTDLQPQRPRLETVCGRR